MTKPAAAAFMAVLGAGCGRSSPPETAGASQSPPTFNKDVAPIVFEHCAPCHRPGQAAPFTLLSFSDLKSRVDKIARAVRAREMPPWLPAPADPGFVGER